MSEAFASDDPFDYLAEFFTPVEEQRVNWRDILRPEQLPPETWERIWAVLGGRGAGKTLTAASAMAELIREYPTAPDGEPTEWGVVAPTIADARDVCLEGRSGLLRALGLSRNYSGWNRSQGQLRIPTGQIVYTGAADDGADRIQGKNLSGCWCDEIGLWAGTVRNNRDHRSMPTWQVAWDESIDMAVRIAPAKIIATGTPKATRGARVLVRRLLDDPDVPVSKLRTADNLANLDERARERLRALEGTDFGRQELEGELLDDVTGGLWKPEWIDSARVLVGRLPPLVHAVVSVDPSGSDAETAAEAGIVVLALGMDGDLYVLADHSLRATAAEWGAVAGRVALQQSSRLRTILVEDDYSKSGAEFVIRQSLRNVLQGEMRYADAAAPVKVQPISTGRRNKAERAVPVTAMYQQGRVHHVDYGEGAEPFEKLEEQMTSWSGDPREPSPDRLDALVHACRFLLIPQEVAGSPSVVTGPRWGNARGR